MHVALKVSPTLPEAAGETKDPFGGGDAPLNAGPKAPQLLIQSWSAPCSRWLIRTSWQRPRLGRLAFWPISDCPKKQSRHRNWPGEGNVRTSHTDARAGARAGTIRRIPFQKPRPGSGKTSPHSDTAYDQRGSPGPFFKNVRVLFKEGDHLLGGGHLFPVQDAPLGLLDDLFQQIPIVSEGLSQRLADGILPILGLSSTLDITVGVAATSRRS